MKEVEGMNEQELDQALASLRGKRRLLGRGVSGSEFVERFRGLIPPDELDRMEAAIERDCETVEA
jgi:hypothetical protein